MPVFTRKSLARSALEEKAGQFRARDIQTFEKCALALELVGRLSQAGLDFIFKGGTSLMLLFEQPKRLSIDVDIICLEPMGKLEEVLNQIQAEGPFTGWNHQEFRDREAPPTKHFQVYYQSVIPQAHTPSIQIDVIQCENPYARLVAQQVKAPFLEREEMVAVSMPSASCLLGDKLAAFAPSTIGYPYQPIGRSGEYGEPRPIKVMKHLFDLGLLTELGSSIEETVRTYDTLFNEQCRYRAEELAKRGIQISRDVSLDDSQDAAFWAARVGGRKLPQSNEKLTFMEKGIHALQSHLFNDAYGRDETRIAAGRATLVAEIVRSRMTDFDLITTLQRPLDINAVRASELKGPWTDLNTIKGTNTQAYALWELAQQLRS